MSMRYVVVACLAMLVGCTTAQDIYFPDGTRGHRITCDTCVTGPADCYQKAGEICAVNGYTIVKMPGGTINSYMSSYSTTGELFIKCKDWAEVPR